MNTATKPQPIVFDQHKSNVTPTLWTDETFRFNHRFVDGKQCSLLFCMTAVL